jgi:hypothetical protein
MLRVDGMKWTGQRGRREPGSLVDVKLETMVGVGVGVGGGLLQWPLRHLVN